MDFRSQGPIEFAHDVSRGSADAYLNLPDHTIAETSLRQLKGDPIRMSQLRATLAQTATSLCRLTDEEVIGMLASQLASGQLRLQDLNRRSVSEAAVQRPMTGYFMQLKYILRARSFERLEDLAGYRRGRL